MPLNKKQRLVGLCSAALGLFGTVSASYLLSPPDNASTRLDALQTFASGSAPSNPADTKGLARAHDSTPVPRRKHTETSLHNKSRSYFRRYQDGVYYGQAQSRHGGLRVAVTIRRHRIAKVKIVSYTLPYSVAKIDPVLPNQVVQRQSPNVDVVSGATLSTIDFYYAVVQALQEAEVAWLKEHEEANANATDKPSTTERGRNK